MTDTEELEQVYDTIGRLRESWLWLALLVEPGRESRAPARVATDRDREAQWYQAMHERAYKETALRHGRSALVATPASARIGVIDAQVVVHGLVAGVARRVAGAERASYVGGRAGVVESVLSALDWLESGSPPAPWVASVLGVLRRAGALDRVRDPVLLDDVDADLTRADRIACAAARVDGDLDRGMPGVVRELVAPIDGRCPACRRKSLQLVHDGLEANRKRWHVRCVSEACVCTGPGVCPCRQRVRYAGRRHAWAFGELAGPYGLWNAMARANPPQPRVGSTARGHGGWPDRALGGRR